MNENENKTSRSKKAKNAAMVARLIKKVRRVASENGR